MPQLYHDLMLKCFEYDVEKRATPVEIAESIKLKSFFEKFMFWR
jgi:hypothetical protein